jgi:outer membrane receptor protein involved in Fe transport
VNLAAGHNFLDGRLNISAALQYYNQGRIDVEGAHPWGNQDWKILNNPAYTPTNGQYRLVIAPQARFSVATNGGVIITAGPLKGIQFGPGGTPYPFVYGQSVGNTYMIGGGNPGEILDDSTPLGSLGIHRTNVYGRIGYDISDDITASFETTVAGAYGHSRVTGSTDVGAGGQITILRDNAYLPMQIAAMMDANKISSFKMGRLNPELGWIEPVTTTGVQRYVASLDGRFGDGWKWSSYFEVGRSRYYQVYTGNRNQTNWNLAVDAVKAPNGQIVCRSTLTNPTNGCIPADVFGNNALNTTNVASFVLQNPYSTTWASEKAAGVNISGEPFSTWAGPVSVAAGAEWRHELTKTTADRNSNLGIFRVGNIIDQFGQFSVKEGYAETVVPLAENQAFAKSLEVNAAVRLTDYSVSGSVWTWKVGATYEPIDTLRFRAARSRDIRAPNIVEFFQAPRLNSGGTVIDRATGIQYAPRTLTGGNTNLTPEEGDTTTYGVVWSPEGVLHGLRASIDRWDIDLEKAIGTISSQNTVDYCFNGNTALCSQIQRDATGAITLVASTYFNLGYIKTSGIDFELDYALPMPIESVGGDFDFRFLATWVEKYITSDGGTNVVNNVGSLNNPDWKISTRLGYNNGPVNVYLENQYVPRLALDPTYTATDAPESLRYVRSMDWTNLSVSYEVWSRDTARVQLFATVNNLFDQDPPIVPNSGVQSTQTNSTLYDVLGRRYQVGVRFSY